MMVRLTQRKEAISLGDPILQIKLQVHYKRSENVIL